MEFSSEHIKAWLRSVSVNHFDVDGFVSPVQDVKAQEALDFIESLEDKIINLTMEVADLLGTLSVMRDGGAELAELYQALYVQHQNLLDQFKEHDRDLQA